MNPPVPVHLTFSSLVPIFVLTGRKILNRLTTKLVYANIYGQNFFSFKPKGPRKDYNDLDLTTLLSMCNRDLDC